MRPALPLLLSSFALVLAGACGPGPTPDTPQSGGDAGAATSTAASGSTTGAASGAGGGDRLEENRQAFMQGCAKGGEGTGPFCECAWKEMRAAIGDAKMGTEGPDEKDLVESHPRVMAACKSKMPEAAVKNGFMAGCIGDREEMKPYCDCSWDEFRKQFSAGDLGDQAIIKSEKFAQARVSVTKTCGPKISEKVVKEGFITACARDPKLQKFCNCAWGELKKMATPAEIEAGLIDKDKVTANLDKACSKLRPAGTASPSPSPSPAPTSKPSPSPAK